MPFLIATMALVGVVTFLNLLLTVGVIRRLREHSERLAGMPAGGAGPAPSGDLILAAGERPGDFTATSVGGEEITLASLTRPTMVAFVTPRCQPCQKLIPELVAAAGALPGGPAQALVVVAVAGDADEAKDEVERLRKVAVVVVESYDGPVSTAFSVKGWPLLCQVGDDGTITTTESQAVLAAPAPVAG